MILATHKSLKSWLATIEAHQPIVRDFGLDRVREVGRRLQLLKPAPRVFLVAGTNGKGSTCEYLARFCQSAGYVVGKATSPHLVHFNERIQINGTPVDDETLCTAFNAIEGARKGIRLNYFEYAALAAMFIFKQQNVDVAVLEVGLGGRFDAMNIVDADVSVITSIDLDHQALLGNTREVIALEKAAIMRPGRPCIVADQSPPASLGEFATKLGTDLIFVTVDDVTMAGLPPGPLSLQAAVAALAAIQSIGISRASIDVDGVVSQASLPGRCQRLDGRPDIMLDVAHNPAAAAHFLRFVQREEHRGQVHAVVGMYKDKAYQEVLRLFSGVVDHWHFTDMPSDRAVAATELARAIDGDGCDVHCYAKISDGFSSVKRNCAINDMILVFGSFPVVAGVLQAAALLTDPKGV
jgi:dihydrofolate synthase / folylpolyglutamate synthase